MTNREKYSKEIKEYNGNEFCKGFVQHIVFKIDRCPMIDCSQCRMLQMLWLDEEYVETEQQVDWSKVPVDTKILVRASKEFDWNQYHFAKYKNGDVYAWKHGRTSWSESESEPWKYAKLAEDGE